MFGLLFMGLGLVVLLLIAVLGPKIARVIFSEVPGHPVWIGQVFRYASAVVAVLWFLSLSFVDVGSQQVGQLTRIWGSALPPGQIIARTSDVRGPQAWILGPGMQFIPFVNVFYDVEYKDQVTILPNHYGLLIARDGAPMPDGAYLAPSFPTGKGDFLDAQVFLNNGGVKGPQLTVLTPGTYRLNTYLWDYVSDDTTLATNVPTGFVGVVKSNVTEDGSQCQTQKATVSGSVDADAMSSLLVPRGCRGVWQDVLTSGAYYLNKLAYEVTQVDTRVQTWPYAGGYTARKIDLNVDSSGNVEQTPGSEDVAVPSDAAGPSISAKVGSFVVHQDLRLVLQISPDNASIVVGAIGDMKKVEDSVVTPAVQSVVRDVLGGKLVFPNELDSAGFAIYRQVDIQDLISNRDVLQNEIEKRIRAAGAKAGLSVREVRLANPDIPPEMLLGNKRQLLAQQLKQAYEQEQIAQQQRITVEQTKATADQQSTLVTAQINLQVANLKVATRSAEGDAEKAFLVKQAEGQKAQADVLGSQNVMMLNLAQRVLDNVAAHPDILGSIHLPSTMVIGENGLNSVAAILNQGLRGIGSQAAQSKP